MKIQSKVLLSLTLVFTLLVSAFFVWSKIKLENDFLVLEKSEVLQNKERLKNTIQSDFDSHKNGLPDWAQWDAMYTSVQAENMDEMHANITVGSNASTFSELILVLKDGRKIFSMEVNQINDTTLISPSSETDSLLEKLTLNKKPQSISHQLQLIQYKNKPMAVAFMNIAMGDQSGDSNAVLLFGQYITPEKVNSISKRTKNPTQLLPFTSLDGFKDDFKEKILNDSTYQFEVIYRDYANTPLFVLQTQFKRQTMQTGKATINAMLFGILALGLALLFAVTITIHKLALKRLLKLSSDINTISDSTDTTLRVSSDALKDEISQLQNKTNTMLSNIETRNAKMRNMLVNMEQGLFVIRGDGTIDPEYSSNTESIFDNNQFGDKDWKELLFDRCLLDNDRKSQMEAAMFSFLGEDLFNWEINSDLVLKELSYDFGEKTKHLEFSYTPLPDENDTVVEFLVSVRDVTLVKELVAQAELKQQELSLLEKLLELSPKDMNRFIEESTKRLAKVKEFLLLSNLNTEEINALFRELHTLKGNSRTCGFRELSTAVHNAEEPVQQMRTVGFEYDLLVEVRQNIQLVDDKINEVNAIYQERFKKILTNSISSNMLLLPKPEVFRLLESYQNIHLNEPEKVKDFLKEIQDTVDSQAINTQEGWASIESHPDNINENSLFQFMNHLADSSFAHLGDSLNRIHDGLVGVSQTLEIPHPLLNVPTEELLIRNEFIGALESVVGHILRNSYDHGIEKPEIRQAKNKAVQGTIEVQYGLSNIIGNEFERPCVWISDDGQGLNIVRIREKALAAGLISDTASLHEIAMCIFKPGLSSREAVSEVSGRGVGMDVVLQELKAIGGNVDLELGTEYDNGFVSFKVKLILPRLSALFFG